MMKVPSYALYRVRTLPPVWLGSRLSCATAMPEGTLMSSDEMGLASLLLSVFIELFFMMLIKPLLVTYTWVTG